MFETTKIDFGEVKESTTKEFLFPFSSDFGIATITQVKAECGCTSTKETNEGIEGTLNIGRVPVHLETRILDKRINLQIEKDGVTYPIQLILKAKVIRK